MALPAAVVAKVLIDELWSRHLEKGPEPLRNPTDGGATDPFVEDLMLTVASQGRFPETDGPRLRQLRHPKLLQVRDARPPHDEVPGYVRPGPAVSFHGGCLQGPARSLPQYPCFVHDYLFLPSQRRPAEKHPSRCQPAGILYCQAPITARVTPFGCPGLRGETPALGDEHVHRALCLIAGPRRCS